MDGVTVLSARVRPSITRFAVAMLLVLLSGGDCVRPDLDGLDDVGFAAAIIDEMEAEISSFFDLRRDEF